MYMPIAFETSWSIQSLSASPFDTFKGVSANVRTNSLITNLYIYACKELPLVGGGDDTPTV